MALEKIAGQNLRDAVAYVTLEPCVQQLDDGSATGCAALLVEAGIRVVYIGLHDNNPRIYRQGWNHLMTRRVTCRDFTAPFREELKEMAATFTGFFQRRTGAARHCQL